jgi:hypothetical protein
MGCRDGLCDLSATGADGHDSAVDAVWPFFGQFVAHDITSDRTPIRPDRSPRVIRNFRTPRANLESLYGAGPIGMPFLYERHDPAKLLLASSGLDVARNQEGVALIGDARNDSHLFINQLHVAFAKLHNEVADRLRSTAAPDTDVFEHARRATTWHYQHIILREFLPQVIGSGLASELVAGGTTLSHAGGERPNVPLEFAAAAYRYGHAQIRQRYQVNPHFGPVPMFPDLIGFGPVPLEHAVDWSLHIGMNAQKAKRIDMRLARALIELPKELSGVDTNDEYASLAARDLARGPMAALPSGEAIARELGIPPLGARTVGLGSLGWRYETPLWLYVLREAEVLCGGEQLGPVGGRIIGEVLVGILDHDPKSFRTLEPEWQPWLGRNDSFSLSDVLQLGAG